jgi:hypothetical protein
MFSPPAGALAPDLRAVYFDGPRVQPPEIPWLWHGYLAPRNLTLLTSLWKAGKTTLVSALLARLGTGGTLAGLPVRAGRAVVVSEEPIEHWQARDAGLRFGSAVGFICRPFLGRPTATEWEGLIDHLVGMHAERPLDLVVVDPLASFFPARTENDAGTMMAALLPLQRLMTRGIAGLVLHHPRKEPSAPGRAARGSGALTGFADVLIEMDRVGPPDADDRRRKLLAFSRHPQTVRRLAVEWAADGSDYVSLGDFAEFEQADGWPVLRMVLEDANRKLTADAIRAGWPADYPRPSQPTVWRWLDGAVKDGRVKRGGAGRRNQPFVYWLPEKEAEWAADPLRPPDPADLPPLDDLLREMGYAVGPERGGQ